MRQINEKHTWFNLDENEDYVKKTLRYTTSDGSMLLQERINRLLAGVNNSVVEHRYGYVRFKKPLFSIQREAFYNYKGLTSIVIPNSVTHIGMSSFAFCEDLKTITIPNSVDTISDYAFEYCTKLETLVLPEGLETIGQFSFSSCSLKNITIPDSIEYIGTAAFYSDKQDLEVNYGGTKEQFRKIVPRMEVVFSNNINVKINLKGELSTN